MQKINDTYYVYASTRIRAADGNGTEKERLERLLDAKSTSAVAALIVDCGLVPAGTDPGAGVTKLLSLALNHAVNLVREAVPEPAIYDFLLYKYDCNNLKTEIKASFRNTDTSGLLFSCGTVSPEETSSAVRERNFSSFPAHMAHSASEAIDAYEQNGDARCIDLIIDGACFADISDGAKSSGIPFFRNYTSVMADITNLRSSARIAASGISPAAAESLLERAFVSGGNVKISALALPEVGAAPFDALAQRMDPSPLKNVTAEITSFDDAERLYEEYIRSIIMPFAYKSFGPEIPACFLILREEEIKRFRKAAALISAGIIGKDKLRERIGTVL